MFVADDDSVLIVLLLDQTLTSIDGVAVREATEALDRLSTELLHFPYRLLSIASGGENPSQRVAAATYLKNFTRKNIGTEGTISEVSKEFKDQLLLALLQAEPALLKVLLELFHIVVVSEFVKKNAWPELVLELRSAIEKSSLISSSDSSWSTVNALMVLLTVVKPFQYFLQPKLVKEPVPQQLESIAKEILVPLMSVFHRLIGKALTTHGYGELEMEKTLHIICKCLYCSVKSHMPSALSPLLGSFCQDMIRILDSLSFDWSVTPSDGYLLRLKAAKRSLLLFGTLVSRHRKYSDKLVPEIVNCLMKIVKHSSNISKLGCLTERIISVAFDVISRVMEIGPGWRLLSPHFSFLLDSAIFPALVLNERDISEWEEDADEFIRKNLPSELEEISGWREDLFTARKSAMNLLGVLAMSKGPPVSTTNKASSAAFKRKKGEKNRNNNQRCSMGDLLVLPFLSKFHVPSKSNIVDASSSAAYFGVLIAYGGLQEFIQEQSPDYVASFVRTRVLPIYSTPGCSPYLVASANWVLGELAACLPEEMNADVFSSLLKALAMPDQVEISCYPVRVSAAGGISSLLENEYQPPEWLPLLLIIIGRIGNEEDEDSILFQLLRSVVESGGQDIATHIPYIISSLVNNMLNLMHPSEDPWSQAIVGGLGTLASMAQTYESTKPEADEENNQATEIWLTGQVTISKSLAALLQHAWLATDVPPTSCIDHLSTMLRFIVLASTNCKVVVELRLTKLLVVWADLLASWNGWEESEDLSVFDCIEEVVDINKKYGFRSFLFRDMPSPPAMPVRPRSVVESIGSFVSKAILEYPSATSRACSSVHTILHVPDYSYDIEGVRTTLATVFSEAAFSHFLKLREKPCSLWRPLLLAISSCYICYSDIVEGVLEKVISGGFELWVSSLAFSYSLTIDTSPSTSPEVKLYVMTLVKVIEQLLDVRHGNANDDLARRCFVSLMEASRRLEEMKEETDDDEDDGEPEEEETESEETDSNNEDSESDECDETEEEFLERYAKAAAALEEGEVIEEVDEEDDERDIDLGTLNEIDPQKLVLSLMEKHHQKVVKIVPSEVITTFLNALPVYMRFFS
uniref:Importin beta-like SAD2-like protein n=1 Tax=Noccaea caerulescens TaxID=107243 RepID=A0A1J3IUD6_NOCCA